jgi:Ca2+-dependent lipid-binding protein
LNPKWNEAIAWDNINIETPLAISVFDHDTLTDDKIGDFDIDLRQQNLDAKVPMGTSFQRDTWYLISDKYPQASLHLKIKFDV